MVLSSSSYGRWLLCAQLTYIRVCLRVVESIVALRGVGTEILYLPTPSPTHLLVYSLCVCFWGKPRFFGMRYLVGVVRHTYSENGAIGWLHIPRQIVVIRPLAAVDSCPWWMWLHSI